MRDKKHKNNINITFSILQPAWNKKIYPFFHSLKISSQHMGCQIADAFAHLLRRYAQNFIRDQQLIALYGKKSWLQLVGSFECLQKNANKSNPPKNAKRNNIKTVKSKTNAKKNNIKTVETKPYSWKNWRWFSPPTSWKIHQWWWWKNRDPTWSPNVGFVTFTTFEEVTSSLTIPKRSRLEITRQMVWCFSVSPTIGWLVLI